MTFAVRRWLHGSLADVGLGEPSPLARVRSLGGSGLLAVSCCVGCQSGEVVTLGRAATSLPKADGGRAAPSASGAPTSDAAVPNEEWVWGEPWVVTALVSNAKDDNPTLTQDLLELYFTSTREGGPGDTDVWFARRDHPDAEFGAPEPLAVVSTEGFDTSPAISPDGSTLWVALELEEGLGGLDIWMSSRAVPNGAWSEPVLVEELNSEADDLPRPVGNAQRTMPMQSRRTSSVYQTYLATRPSPSEPFADPVLLDELVVEEDALGDAFLTEDGLVLLFARSRDELGDLYMARRASVEEPFGEPLALDSINTEFDERDPWLSRDGSRFFFSSDRDGTLDIYEARVTGLRD